MIAPSTSILGSKNTWGIWERMVPEALNDDAANQSAWRIHQHRYETAAQVAIGKRVLDIASGTGFGSKMLKQAGAAEVIGVDIAPESIAYAQQHYGIAGVQYIQADAEKFEWPEKFDVIATYETIEHVPHPDVFLARLRSLIQPDGYLFLSVPLGKTRHIDVYHLHEFDQEEIFQLIEQAGFTLEGYRIEPWKMTNQDMQALRKTNPEQAAPWKDLFFTDRGRQVLHDCIVKGGIGWDWLLVCARPRPEGVAVTRPVLRSLD